MTALSTLVPTGTFYRLGSSGPVVKEIQLALARRGYSLKGTGWFGPATDVAVEAEQKRLGLHVDGDFGNDTAKALDKVLANPVATQTEFSEVSQPLWLQAGIKLIGVKEGAGSRDNQQIINWAKDEGGSIAENYTHDSIPWCALFANHCLTKVSLKGTETLWALDFAGKWPSVQLAGPAVGAFAPMLRSGGGHIIQIVGRDQHGNIMGLGGNQSDAVNIEPFALSRLNKGFWWPKGISMPVKIGLKDLPIVRSDGKLATSLA